MAQHGEARRRIEKRLKGLIDNLIQSFQTLSILAKTYNFVPKNTNIKIRY